MAGLMAIASSMKNNDFSIFVTSLFLFFCIYLAFRKCVFVFYHIFCENVDKFF